MVSIVTLISGRGSNFEAIVKTAQKEQWPVQFAGVIANHSAAKGLDFARLQGIPAFTIEHQEHATRESFDAALIQQIDELGADLVVLAGFMRILTPGFIRHFEGRMLLVLYSERWNALQASKIKALSRRMVCNNPSKLDGPLLFLSSFDDGLEIRSAAVKWFLDGRLRIEGNQVKLQPPESQFFKL